VSGLLLFKGERNMKDENLFGSSNFWLGTLVVFLIAFTLILSWIAYDVMQSRISAPITEDRISVYNMALSVFYFIISITAVMLAFAARKKVQELGSSDSLLERQNQVQREIISDGSPELLDSWLRHDDELEFAVRLSDARRSWIFFKRYVGFCTPKAIKAMWFLSASLGNIEVVREYVESGLLSDFNIKDSNGNTAAHIAVIYQQDELIDYFSKLHAEGRMNLGIRNNGGKIPCELLDSRQQRMSDLLSAVEPDPTETVQEGDAVIRDLGQEGDVGVECSDETSEEVDPNAETKDTPLNSVEKPVKVDPDAGAKNIPS